MAIQRLHSNKRLSNTVIHDIINDFAGLNEVWEAWVAEGHAPARACVEAAMFKPSLLVEMSVVAVQG